MFKTFVVHSSLLILLFSGWNSSAQISPGDLTKEHAKLEGMSNCTQCHELGDKVTNQKCLDCHKEIKNLMTENRGFHASNQVENQSCTKCHSEHHGRNFDMVRFDTNNFNHNLTGYRLEGAHKAVDCKQCHQTKNIADASIKKRKTTYLGLSTDCLSCHEDFHQGSMPNDCLKCHSMEAFSPVANFNHNETNFPLKGKHETVDCKECHKVTVKDGKEFQQFKGLAFSDCKACHQDPHQSKLPGACAQCHNESSFTAFNGLGRFNHKVTGFTLNGQHQSINCFDCHAKSSNPALVFQDRKPTEESNCIACHQDPHDDKFGQDCAQCHQEQSFIALKEMDFFDHSVTDFPLEGQHQGVDCRECHKARFSTPIDFSQCKNCHDDYHKGQFATNNISPDCDACHSVQEKFNYTSFTITKHQETQFPLEGAHLATPCFACHVDEASKRWEFRDIGNTCIDCHDNVHESYLDKKYYPENNCVSCHGTESWDRIAFDHNKTDWPLTGKHLEVSCSKCHFEISDNNEIISQNFRTLTTDCSSCHENVHGDDFAVNGVTECSRCHVTNSWMPEKFNHNTTRFPLEGKHKEVDCKQCHEIQNKLGETTIIYKLNKLACIDCHS